MIPVDSWMNAAEACRILRIRPATLYAYVSRGLGQRLRRGEWLDGFGHPLYRNGDPRAAALLDLLQERYGASGELAFLLELADAAGAVVGDKPSLDFGLVAVARVLRLPPGSALTLLRLAARSGGSVTPSNSTHRAS